MLCCRVYVDLENFNPFIQSVFKPQGSNSLYASLLKHKSKTRNHSFLNPLVKVLRFLKMVTMDQIMAVVLVLSDGFI